MSLLVSTTDQIVPAPEVNPKRWKAMPIIARAVSIIIIDATIVNVVLPVLIRDISLTVSQAEWVNSVYALVFAALLITVGRIGDVVGRRRLLIIGIVIFGAASVLAAASGNGTMLITARLLLRIRSFRYGAIAALIVALGEFGMLFALPLYLQGALGYTALGTGLIVLGLAIGTFLISGGSAQLTRRLGGRGVVRVGLALEVIAVAGLALSISLSVNAVALADWLFLYGTGVGMATAQLTSVILADVPVSQSGQASELQSTVRQLGSALGIAILGTILISTLSAATAANLQSVAGLDASAQH